MRSTQAARRVGARGKRLGWDALRRLAGAANVDLVWRHYYSPIPDVGQLPAEIWDRRSPLAGVRFDLQSQLELLEGELLPAAADFDPPLEDPGDGRYWLLNTTYPPLDAWTLYGVIRRWRPRRVIELGSGLSSLVITSAAQANARDGRDVDYRVFDPEPWLPALEDSVGTLHRLGAAQVPLQEFAALQANDVLFVDTTHTVKVGGDVNRVVLDILPIVAPGVLVHFHDIFLPYEYPRTWMADHQLYWAEQYLLQAFLCFNEAFEVLVATHAVSREWPVRFQGVIPEVEGRPPPGALWLRRA